MRRIMTGPLSRSTAGRSARRGSEDPAQELPGALLPRVDEHLLGNKLAEVGDKVVVISGSPPGIIGSTNDIRIHKVGDAVHGNAPIYRDHQA